MTTLANVIEEIQELPSIIIARRESNALLSIIKEARSERVKALAQDLLEQLPSEPKLDSFVVMKLRYPEGLKANYHHSTIRAFADMFAVMIQLVTAPAPEATPELLESLHEIKQDVDQISNSAFKVRRVILGLQRLGYDVPELDTEIGAVSWLHDQISIASDFVASQPIEEQPDVLPPVCTEDDVYSLIDLEERVKRTEGDAQREQLVFDGLVMLGYQPPLVSDMRGVWVKWLSNLIKSKIEYLERLARFAN